MNKAVVFAVAVFVFSSVSAFAMPFQNTIKSIVSSGPSTNGGVEVLTVQLATPVYNIDGDVNFTFDQQNITWRTIGNPDVTSTLV